MDLFHLVILISHGSAAHSFLVPNPLPLSACSVVKDKAGPHKEIYPYVIQELRPTLNELGISTPEELGLDKV
uniref:Cytochrome c oxidase subunit 5A, mitochondrial n=1 Tax=Peromyscus maniculatus bairdii TaxID=230844 RepID=A0A8C8W756_PERMB